MPYYKGTWFSEQGTAYEGKENRSIEYMMELEEDELQGFIRSTAEKEGEQATSSLLRQAMVQIGSMQLDGVLYTNLLDEFKRGASGQDVLERAKTWEIWSTSLDQDEGGFPNRGEEETSGGTFLRSARQAPKSLIGKILGWLSASLKGILGRLARMLRLVIPLLNHLKLSIGLSGISVNAGLPPSVSFNFDIQGVPAIPLHQFMQNIGIPVP